MDKAQITCTSTKSISRYGDRSLRLAHHGKSTAYDMKLCEAEVLALNWEDDTDMSG